MAPQTEKPSTVDKCHNETVETKNKFSLRWLLRRSKSSKSAKELTQAEKHQSTTVPMSKSCDSGVTGFSNMDKCSAFLLWRLFPSRGKSPTRCDKFDQVSIASGHSFKTSFSSGDVYGMLSAAKSPFATTKSSHNILASTEFQHDSRLPHPNPSSDSLNKQISNADHSHVTAVQDCGQLNQKEENLSTVYHLVLCKLCLSMVPVIDMYCLEECGCVFCVSCMKQYLTVNIKEGNVMITCPDADCQGEGNVQLAEIQELVGDEVFDMFQRFQLNREVEMDPTRTWCPTAGCETICTIRPSANPDKGVPVHCHNCNLTFCSACKERCHGSKTCEELRKALKEEEEFPVSDEEEASIKRCPNCRIPIERDEGCAQMMCKRCKHVFCWYCLASLDDDFLLRHYDKGPCRNKLGHSRASVVWHRTQVVGIFAGFGFLLLVASPLLLLAAPCLLCCRCKNCKFFYEEPTPL